jgi:hypothetical protein
VTHARASLPLIRSIIVVLINPSIRLANLPKTAYIVNVSKKEKGVKATIYEKEPSADKYRGLISECPLQCGYTIEKYLQYWALLGISQPKHRIIKPAASLANYRLHSHAHSFTNPLWEGEAENVECLNPRNCAMLKGIKLHLATPICQGWSSEFFHAREIR